MSEPSSGPVKKPPKRRPPRSRLREHEKKKWVPTTPKPSPKPSESPRKAGESPRKVDKENPDFQVPKENLKRPPKRNTPRAKTPNARSDRQKPDSPNDKAQTPGPRSRRPPQTAAARRFNASGGGGVLAALRTEDKKMDFLSQLQKSFSAATGGGSEDEDEDEDEQATDDVQISAEDINQLLNKKSGHVKLSELKRAIRERNSPSNRMQVQENLRKMFSNNSGIGSVAKPQLARDILLGTGFEDHEPLASPTSLAKLPENIQSLSEVEQAKAKLQQTKAQEAELMKQLDAARGARKNDMTALRESFTLLNKRLQQQLEYLNVENTKLNERLLVVNKKNTVVQEHLSVIGERNLAITSEFDILRKLEEAEAEDASPVTIEADPVLEAQSPTFASGGATNYPGYTLPSASNAAPMGGDMNPNTIYDPMHADLVGLAQTFNGSRLIQSQLDGEESTGYFFNCFFTQCKNRTYEVMTNKFGRFAFEKMLSKCNDDQRLCILQSLSHSLTAVACDTHGSFGTQVLIKSLTTDEQIDLAAQILKSQTLILMTDYKGHYLIVVLISQFPYEKFSFIDEVIIANCAAVSMNNQGLQVVKAIFQHRTPAQLNPLLQMIAANALSLVENQYGNYVVQQALVYPLSVEEAHSKDANGKAKNTDRKLHLNHDQRNWEHQNQKLQQIIIRSLEGNFRPLSLQKFSSNVVEVILLRQGPKWVKVIVKELLGSPPACVRSLVSDRFGNYVLQTALNVSNVKLVQLATDRILPHLQTFRLNLRNKWFNILQTARKRVGLDEIPPETDDKNKAKVIVEKVDGNKDGGDGNGRSRKGRGKAASQDKGGKPTTTTTITTTTTATKAD